MFRMNLLFWGGGGGSQQGGGGDESSTKTAASVRRRDSPMLTDDDDDESCWSVCSSAPGSQDVLDVCDRWMGVLQLNEDQQKQLVQSPTGVRDLYSPNLDLVTKPAAISLVLPHQQPTSGSSNDKTNSTTKPSSGGATTTNDEVEEDRNTTRSLVGNEEKEASLEVAAVSHHPEDVMKLHTKIPEIIYLHRHDTPRSFGFCMPCTDQENVNAEDDAASSCSLETGLPKIVYVHRHSTPCTHQKSTDDKNKKSNDNEDLGDSLHLPNGIPKEIYIRHSLEMKALRRLHRSSEKSVDSSLQSSSSLIAEAPLFGPSRSSKKRGILRKKLVDDSDSEAFEHALVDI